MLLECASQPEVASVSPPEIARDLCHVRGLEALGQCGKVRLEQDHH